MKFKILTIAIAVTLQAQAPAFAQDTVKPPSSEPAATVQTGPLTKQAENSSGSKVVPKVSVRWDCGRCEQNPKVAPLIEEEYIAEAAAKGYSISATERAEITIKEYQQRNPAARVFLGVFAGKDKLSTKLSFRGKDYVVVDYSANALQGMNSLCKSVAEKSLEQVLSVLNQ